MAEYLVELINPGGMVVGNRILEVWEGNRDKSNRKAIAQGQTLFAYLAYQDVESHDALWLALGDEGLDWAKEVGEAFDREKGALTLDYIHTGKKKKAVFSLNKELAETLSDSNLFMTDAVKGFALAWSGSDCATWRS